MYFMKRFRKMPTERKVTIRDVARRAGVAIGTVSRVLNGHKDVSPKLKGRVERVIAELGYHPNVRAQLLSRQTSPVLSFILSNRSFNHHMHSLVLQGVEEYCTASGYFVVFTRFDYSRDIPVHDLKLPMVLQSHGVADSVIVSGTNYDNFLEALDRLNLRYVLFANNLVSESPRAALNQVRFDDEAGSVEAVSYLIQLGHQHIWFIGDTSTPWCRTRHLGYLKTMRAAGLDARAMTAGLSTDQFTDGYRCAEFVLANDPEATAIFCGNDDIAYGAWEALSIKGKRVPTDISLIGFDDKYGSLRTPQLTSVGVPALDVGRELARLAIARLEPSHEPLPEVVLPTRLFRRGTCLPLRPITGSERQLPVSRTEAS